MKPKMSIKTNFGPFFFICLGLAIYGIFFQGPQYGRGDCFLLEHGPYVMATRIIEVGSKNYQLQTKINDQAWGSVYEVPHETLNNREFYQRVDCKTLNSGGHK